MQIARLSLQSSELTPPPTHQQASVALSPFGSMGEGVGEANTDEGTGTLVLYCRYIIIHLRFHHTKGRRTASKFRNPQFADLRFADPILFALWKDVQCLHT